MREFREMRAQRKDACYAPADVAMLPPFAYAMPCQRRLPCRYYAARCLFAFFSFSPPSLLLIFDYYDYHSFLLMMLPSRAIIA